MSSRRVNIQQIQSKAYQGMFVLEDYIASSELGTKLVHLMKIRASQINGCAFCINMHCKEALTDGESQDRIFLLDAWEESGLFSDQERALLKMTEEVTNIKQQGLTDSTYQQLLNCFSEQQIAQAIMVAVTINAWNRIAISTNMPIS